MQDFIIMFVYVKR